MPIFEYVCTDCQKSFEAIVNSEDSVMCPGCNSVHLEKQYSRFGMGRTSGDYPSLPLYKSGGCGCGAGGCGCSCKN